MDETLFDTSPLVGKLKEFLPLDILLINKTQWEPVWDYMIRKYHYLSCDNMIGQRIKYMVFHGDRPIAALSFNRATLRVGVRDKYLGWTSDQKQKLLPHVINNNRFLILPWVRIRNLASYLLARTLKIASHDWLALFGTEPYLAETFVDRNKYPGTCYKAANWLYLGETLGYGKIGKAFVYHGNRKGVFVYPLNREFLRIISEDPCRHPNPQKVSKRVPNMMLQKSDWNPDIVSDIGLNEQTVSQMGDLLDEYMSYYEDCYSHKSQVTHAETVVKGLLSDLDRKSIEPIALRYSDEKAVRPMQMFFKNSPWDIQRVRSRYLERILNIANDPQGMVTVDGSDFPKKGKHSVGVARQYCGSLGKTENCQAGIFIGYSGSGGYGLLDGQLYLPQSWFEVDGLKRWDECAIPEDTVFQTKLQIASKMITKLMSEGFFQAQWVGCDSAFGSNLEFRDSLPENVWFFADIHSNGLVWREQPQWILPEYKGRGKRPEKLVPSVDPVPVSAIAADDTIPWQTVTLTDGAKGPIKAKVKYCRILECRDGQVGQELWLYIRQYENNRIKYSLSNAPASLPISQLHRAATLRWPIEQCFEECKSFLGMGDYEARSWTAWHRHMLLVFIAHLFITELRLRFKKNSLS